MFVLLRPGPYVCGEWDFGGLPSRLLNNATAQIRTINDPVYKAGTQSYLTALSKHIVSHMAYNSGNILLVQIENEYGSWPSSRQDPAYV